MAVEQNFIMFIGEDRDWQFTVVDSAGNPQNMGGWAMECIMRIAPVAVTAVFTKTTGAGEIAFSNSADGTNDRATVKVIDDDTVDLVPRKYSYTLRRTDAGNEVVIAYGEVDLQRRDTR